MKATHSRTASRAPGAEGCVQPASGFSFRGSRLLRCSLPHAVQGIRQEYVCMLSLALCMGFQSTDSVSAPRHVAEPEGCAVHSGKVSPHAAQATPCSPARTCEDKENRGAPAPVLERAPTRPRRSCASRVSARCRRPSGVSAAASVRSSGVLALTATTRGPSTATCACADRPSQLLPYSCSTRQTTGAACNIWHQGAAVECKGWGHATLCGTLMKSSSASAHRSTRDAQNCTALTASAAAAKAACAAAVAAPASGPPPSGSGSSTFTAWLNACPCTSEHKLPFGWLKLLSRTARDGPRHAFSPIPAPSRFLTSAT